MRIDMKKALIIVLALALAACIGSSEKNTTHRIVTPYPAGVDIEALEDCIVPAKFSCDDFNWMGGNLIMTVMSEDIYDAVEVTQMECGDTLLYNGETIVVEAIGEEAQGILAINGGLEQGGAWLQPYEGGTYRAIQFDDHSMYTELGTAQVALAEDFIIIDCGDMYEDPSDTITTSQKTYLEGLKGYKRDFNPLNTRVVIEEGMITKIHRKWIP